MSQIFPNSHQELTESSPLPLYDDKNVDEVRYPLMASKQVKDTFCGEIFHLNQYIVG